MNVWGRIGVAIAIAMALSQLFNAVMAWGDPVGFSQRIGLPLLGGEDPRWVGVYALRAAFIGLMVLGLVAARAWRALALVSVAAIITPLGDAYLAFSHGAPAATVLRHCAYVVVIALGAWTLSEAARTATTSATEP